MASAAAQKPPLTPPNPRIQLTDNSDPSGKVTGKGILSSTGLSILQQHHKTINGLSPIIACTCTNVGNVYKLTPFNISPDVLNYYDYWGFSFVASATSTGVITATVVPTTGTLPTLPVLKTHGSTAATTGDLTINLFYIMFYVDTLNSGNGAFVLS